MQVTLVRTGGYTGIPLTVSVNAANLAADDANDLRQLIETTNFFHLSDVADTSVQPDRYEYEITVESGDRTHTVNLSETAVPEALQLLIKWLLARRKNG